MLGWHHRLNGHEFQETAGDSEGQGSLVGCSPCGREDSDTTEHLPFTFHFHALEKEMATHSSILAWRIPWTEEPGGELCSLMDKASLLSDYLTPS